MNKLFLFFIASFFLMGCGGASSSSDDTTSHENESQSQVEAVVQVDTLEINNSIEEIEESAKKLDQLLNELD
ncbi:hypothetical protein [Flammeovirga sp. SJP92]|uniref:hypothetical protein n=1 Tax=Flammeovirga sp. SJP92 TaxID=1775430 RepID=UPI0012FAAF7E|nr:hypothetical protein [Flammeovirga sp. SJP92]